VYVGRYPERIAIPRASSRQSQVSAASSAAIVEHGLVASFVAIRCRASAMNEGSRGCEIGVVEQIVCLEAQFEFQAFSNTVFL